MRRGFKAEAERVAQRVRLAMKKKPTEPLEAIELATHVGADVKRADELTSLEKLQALEELQSGAFSACTFSINDRHIIVFNPLASPGRRQSDIAHEVAHLLLKHQLKDVQHIGTLAFFTCDPDEEQEANWLGGCLLLPRGLLLSAVRRGMDAAAIAEEYAVSEQMANFRLRTTGVNRQVRTSKK